MELLLPLPNSHLANFECKICMIYIQMLSLLKGFLLQNNNIKLTHRLKSTNFRKQSFTKLSPVLGDAGISRFRGWLVCIVARTANSNASRIGWRHKEWWSFIWKGATSFSVTATLSLEAAMPFPLTLSWTQALD